MLTLRINPPKRMWPEKFPIDDRRPWLKNVPKSKDLMIILYQNK